MAKDGKYAIETRDLNLWYGTFQALFDVDLDIRDGIITSLIGPSGCGKSTLGKLILRLLKPTSGSICFDDQEIGGPARPGVGGVSHGRSD